MPAVALRHPTTLATMVAVFAVLVSPALPAFAAMVWPGLPVDSTPAPPAKIKDVRPVYPPESLRAGDEGWVIIEAKIDASGAVSDVRILRSSCHRLDEAALAAVRQWKWEKLLLNGRPTPWVVTVRVPFRLPKPFASRAARAGACRWTDMPKAVTAKTASAASEPFPNPSAQRGVGSIRPSNR